MCSKNHETQYFSIVEPKKFRKILKAKYFGESPFAKSESYPAFVTKCKQESYDGQALYTEIRFSYYLLHYCARKLNIKPSENDRIIALKLFFGIQEESESIKCKKCNGIGYIRKN